MCMACNNPSDAYKPVLTPKPIGEITAKDFFGAHFVEIHGAPYHEKFVLTSIGRIIYAVSIDHGYAYTRPQLIEKYSNISALFTTTLMTR